MSKRIISLVLALVMCMGLCTLTYAANGDITISVGNVDFDQDLVHVETSGSEYDAYFCYAQLPDNTTFNHVYTEVTFTGSSLEINGSPVVSNNGVFADFLDFTSIVTMEVFYGTTSKTYYVSAYPSTITNVTMQFEYGNAIAFSQLEDGDSYGTTGWLDYVDEWQIETMADAVSDMDTMCSSMDPAPTGQNHGWTTSVNPGDTPYELLEYYENQFSGFYYSGDCYYIQSIGSLDEWCTGYQTCGWMYQVTRGGVTYTPMIGINGWKLIPGDIVIWRYTCDYGADIGSYILD